ARPLADIVCGTQRSRSVELVESANLLSRFEAGADPHRLERGLRRERGFERCQRALVERSAEGLDVPIVRPEARVEAREAGRLARDDCRPQLRGRADERYAEPARASLEAPRVEAVE